MSTDPIHVLPDGRRVALRPVTVADAPALAELLDASSDTSVHRRFFGGRVAARRWLADHGVRVDGHTRLGRVAVVDGVCVGHADFAREQRHPRRAELSFWVADAFQRRGLGRALCAAVAADALGVGIATFGLLIAPHNRAGATFARSVGAQLSFDGDVLEADVPTAALLPALFGRAGLPAAGGGAEVDAAA